MPVPQRSRPIKSDNFGRPTGISNLRHIAWSPTGTGIATCTGSVIRVWNPERATVRASQELRVTPVSGGPGGPVGVVEKLAWNPIKEAELASTGSDGAVRLWDVRVGTGG
ncbi:hypothetical protein H2203_004184 [Taxawa tesnikishii (nom. ined.)]|nr:hypothetical protein H2203_004184 [Dothideales sp. JES 119]